MSPLPEVTDRFTQRERGVLLCSLIALLLSFLVVDRNNVLSWLPSCLPLTVVAMVIVRNNRAESHSAQRSGIDWIGYEGLSVKGVVVSEFCYLLRYLTHGKLRNFNDFSAIYAQREQILLAIEQECLKPVLAEQCSFALSRQVALDNLTQLARIVNAISAYYVAVTPGITQRQQATATAHG